MVKFSQISTLLEDYISKLSLSKTPIELYEPIGYILEDGGKRMRPMLMLLACDAYCGSVERCIMAASGIEIFHNFTLLHDDIMDKASMRRGRDTVHVKWSDNIAILSGDAMVVMAYMQFVKGCNGDKLQTVLEIFNKAAIEVCEGQQFDMNFEQSQDVTIDQYLEMIRLKTSVLLAASLEIGAVIGGANQDQQRNQYEFGVNLGLAFQIQDDILDTYGDKNKFGKKIGGDIAVGKKTFLFITAYNKANAEDKETLKTSRDYDTIRAIYDKLGVVEVAKSAVQRYYERAIEFLAKSGDEKSMLELKNYAHSLLERDK